MSEQLTVDQAVARAMSGGIVWDDELPESMRGFGVPPLLRFDPPEQNPAEVRDEEASS